MFNAAYFLNETNISYFSLNVKQFLIFVYLRDKEKP